MLDSAYVLSCEPLRVIRWSYLDVSTDSASYGLHHVFVPEHYFLALRRRTGNLGLCANSAPNVEGERSLETAQSRRHFIVRTAHLDTLLGTEAVP
jgi:hypothetical protein